MAVPAALATHVDPVEQPGNPTCAEFGTDWVEFKIEPVTAGTYSDGTLTVTLAVDDTADGPVLDWSSNIGVDAVIVKGGGDDGGGPGNVYTYDPESTGDGGLHAAVNPNNPNDQYYGLSHVSFCYDVPVDTGPAVISLDVDKLNDANGDGTFSDDEQAPAPGADVAFRVTVTNTSATASVDLSSATDVWPTADGTDSADLFELCDELSDDTVLAAGASVTCTFTLTGYAPAADSSLVDTVTVAGHEEGDVDNTTSDADDSTVTTPAEEVLDNVLERDDDEVVAENPAITLSKVALVAPNGDGLDVITYDANDGDEEMIPYRYTIINTGDVTLTGVTLVDDVLGPISLPTAVLAPGEAITMIVSHTLTGADAAAGEVVNVAVAEGTSPEGEQVRATAEERVLVMEVLGLTLERDVQILSAAGDVAQSQLPRTGADPVGWATLAFALLIAGATALFASRSRATAR